MNEMSGRKKGLRQRFASFAVLVLVCSVLTSIFFEDAAIISGIAALLVLAGTVLISTPRTRVVVGVLVSIGVLGLVVSLVLFDEQPAAHMLRSLNQDLVAILVGGAFVRGLLPHKALTTKPKLSGTAAVVRTAFVGHFMGSVLNMVAMGIVGDRLKQERPLSVRNASLVTVSYSTAALWSPFWTVAALIAGYFPYTSMLPVSVSGVAFASVVLVGFALGNASRRSPAERREGGYPLQPRALAMPLSLMAFVLVTHAVFPNVPVPRFVLLASILIPLAIGFTRVGFRETVQRLNRVISHGLTTFANESALFVAAGILTVGVAATTVHIPYQLSGVPPTVLNAWLLTVAIVLLSIVGVHQIVTISVAAAFALLVPGGEIVYATAIAWGWCIAPTVGPLAGTVIYVSQRYGLKDRALIAANLPFAAVATVLAFPAIAFAQWLSVTWGLV